MLTVQATVSNMDTDTHPSQRRLCSSDNPSQDRGIDDCHQVQEPLAALFQDVLYGTTGVGTMGGLDDTHSSIFNDKNWSFMIKMAMYISVIVAVVLCFVFAIALVAVIFVYDQKFQHYSRLNQQIQVLEIKQADILSQLAEYVATCEEKIANTTQKIMNSCGCK